MVADRYLAISYGVNSFTDILVNDLAYKRWGKLQIPHVAVFEYYQPNYYGAVTWNAFGTITWDQLGNTSWADLVSGLDTVDLANETFAVIQSDGTVYTAVLDNVAENESGVLLLGKYQFLRDRWLTLDEVAIKNVKPLTPGQFQLLCLPTLDGDTFETAVTGFEDPTNKPNGKYANYYFSHEGKNHTLVLKNTFNISDLEMVFHVSGHG
jgi:hypothetical protein